MTWTLHIPEALPSLNETMRQHWARRRKDAKRWGRFIAIEMMLRKVPAASGRRAVVIGNGLRIETRRAMGSLVLAEGFGQRTGSRGFLSVVKYLPVFMFFIAAITHHVATLAIFFLVRIRTTFQIERQRDEISHHHSLAQSRFRAVRRTD